MTKAELKSVGQLLRDALKDTHLSLDSVWYNPSSKRLWVGVTDLELKKTGRGCGQEKITAWKVIRLIDQANLETYVEDLVDVLLKFQEMGVVRG